jgi:protein-S-isoprenylcysteine O-methyltransferase
MTPALFFPSPAGAMLLAVLFAVWGALEVWVNLRRAPSGSASRDRWTRYLVAGGMTAAACASTGAAAFVHRADLTAARPLTFWCGLALMLAGLVLRVCAIRQLNQYFLPAVVLQPGHRVFTGGLYSRLRHPAYSGTLLTVLGFGLALTNWVSLLVMVVAFINVYLIRIVVEEAALLEAFGDEYRQYMKHTYRLIPFLL